MKIERPLKSQGSFDEPMKINRVSDLTPCAPFPKGKGDVT